MEKALVSAKGGTPNGTVAAIQRLTRVPRAVPDEKGYAEAIKRGDGSFREGKSSSRFFRTRIIRDYAKAINFKRGAAEPYYKIGNVFSYVAAEADPILDDKKAMCEKAIRCFSKALRLEPEHEGALFNRGNAYLALKKYPEARSDYDAYIKLKPGDATAYCNRGTAHFALREFEKAVSDYSEAIRLTPDFVEARVNRANAHFRIGKNDEGLADLKTLKEKKKPVVLSLKLGD